MQYRGTVNSVEAIGWLGSDPELHYTSSGAAVANFSVATKRPSHADGEPKTEWIPVEAWEKLAEMIARQLQKGSRVRVVGLLTTRSWKDRASGQKCELQDYFALIMRDYLCFRDLMQRAPKTNSIDLCYHRATSATERNTGRSPDDTATAAVATAIDVAHDRLGDRRDGRERRGATA